MYFLHRSHFLQLYSSWLDWTDVCSSEYRCTSTSFPSSFIGRSEVSCRAGGAALPCLLTRQQERCSAIWAWAQAGSVCISFHRIRHWSWRVAPFHRKYSNVSEFLCRESVIGASWFESVVDVVTMGLSNVNTVLNMTDVTGADGH